MLEGEMADETEKFSNGDCVPEFAVWADKLDRRLVKVAMIFGRIGLAAIFSRGQL